MHPTKQSELLRVGILGVAWKTSEEVAFECTLIETRTGPRARRLELGEGQESPRRERRAENLGEIQK